MPPGMGGGKIRRCKACGAYTLKERCPSCGGETASPHPPPFSLDDKYLDILVRVRQKRRAEGAGI